MFNHYNLVKQDYLCINCLCFSVKVPFGDPINSQTSFTSLLEGGLDGELCVDLTINPMMQMSTSTVKESSHKETSADDSFDMLRKCSTGSQLIFISYFAYERVIEFA